MRTTWILAGAFIGVFAAPPLQAFTLIRGGTLTAVGWQKNDITFDIEKSCAAFTDDVNSAIAQAQDLWNQVPSSALKLSIGTTVTLPQAITTYVGAAATAVAPTGNPIVYCDTSFQTNSGQPADQIPGFAGAQNVLTSGQIQGGLLVLNFQSAAKANVHTLGPDSASIILAHEIGHILGLGHSSDANALMYYSTNPSRKLVLAQDDINGLSYLYPRSEPGTGGMLGCATIQDAGGGRRMGRDSRSRNSSPAPGDSSRGAAEFGGLVGFLFLARRVWGIKTAHHSVGR
jgi:hypothetical protein